MQATPDNSTTQYLKRSAELLPFNPAAAQLQAEQALHLAVVGGTASDVAAAHLAIGESLLAQSRYDQALRYFRRGLRLYQQGHHDAGRARSLRLLARTQYLQGDTGQAHNTYRQALELTERLREPVELAQVHTQLGDLYGALGQ